MFALKIATILPRFDCIGLDVWFRLFNCPAIEFHQQKRGPQRSHTKGIHKSLWFRSETNKLQSNSGAKLWSPIGNISLGTQIFPFENYSEFLRFCLCAYLSLHFSSQLYAGFIKLSKQKLSNDFLRRKPLDRQHLLLGKVVNYDFTGPHGYLLQCGTMIDRL